MQQHKLIIVAAPPSDGEAKCSCGMWDLLTVTVSGDTREAFIKKVKPWHRQHKKAALRRELAAADIDQSKGDSV